VKKTYRVANASGAERERGAAGGWLLIGIAAALALWWFAPWEMGPGRKAGPVAEPRPVVARGSLAEDEQNNISVFKAASPSAVYITTRRTSRSPTRVYGRRRSSACSRTAIWRCCASMRRRRS
jgi:hypothetical protein